jgi:8-oxo-dGTP pyrophosphatase MutT (NUDIX family)/GNAT superfamily N-acetyltransferase
MNLPQGLRLSTEDQPAPKDWDRLGLALDAYNRGFLGETRYSQFGLFVRNRDDEIMAGLAATTYAGWLFVAELWVHADLRRQGIGSHLLTSAERRAAAAGCHSAMLDTFSFQAPEFYPRFGYRAYATLDYPPHHQRIFFRKQLLAEPAAPAGQSFPVSVKGVLFEGRGVVLLENERREWELPGGRLEAGEAPAACLAREFAEELGADITVGAILDTWVYEVSPWREVVIVTYGVSRRARSTLRVSGEHRRLGLFMPSELDGLPMPENYRRSIRDWAMRCGIEPVP